MRTLSYRPAGQSALGILGLTCAVLWVGVAFAELPPTPGQAMGGDATGGAVSDADRGVIYSPVGKRDPFRPPRVDPLDRDVATVNPLEKFNIDQFALRAILKDSRGAHAMLEDPEGKSHIITEGDIVGRERGTLSRILNTAILITQRTYNYRGVETLFEKVLYLPQKESEQMGLDPTHATREERRVPNGVTIQAPQPEPPPPASPLPQVAGAETPPAGAAPPPPPNAGGAATPAPAPSPAPASAAPPASPPAPPASLLNAAPAAAPAQGVQGVAPAVGVQGAPPAPPAVGAAGLPVGGAPQ